MSTLHTLKSKRPLKPKRHLQVAELTTALSIPSTSQQTQANQKRAVLKLGTPNKTEGIPVSLQIGNEGTLPQIETTGWLPPVTKLLTTQTDWQQAYCQNHHRQAFRIDMPEVQVTNISYRENFDHCHQAQQELTQQINSWLNSELFRPVRETLLSQLHPTDMIRLIFQTDDLHIRSLPLHLWDWFERYPQAELVLSQTTYQASYCQWPQSIINRASETAQVKILAVLGDSKGLDLRRDLDLLQALPDVALTCLVEPERSQLNKALQEQSWDIFFFAGHSRCTDQAQQLHISSHESLSLHDLKHSFQKATEQGLKLAIFNACDGLKLLKSLNQELTTLPTTILMRHPVPDRVAQAFLQYFLNAFSQGIPLHLAVREAREQLEDLESQFPFASWLPVLWQNPSTQPITWAHLKSDL